MRSAAGILRILLPAVFIGTHCACKKKSPDSGPGSPAQSPPAPAAAIPSAPAAPSATADDVERAAPPADLRGGANVRIRLETQATLRNFLRIGLGFIRRDEDSGAPRRRLVAGLWIYVRDDPSKNRVLRVHAGQRVAVAGYTLFVQEVFDGRPGYVLLRVLPPKP